MIDLVTLQKEYIRCFKDKSRIYMIQNFLNTYDATQGKQVKFMLFPRQQDICKTLAGGNNIVTTKPRQAGITTTVAGFISCEMCLADNDRPQTVLCIGNTLDLAQQFLFKVRDFLLQFPLWMWGDEYFDKGYDVTKPPENKNVIFKTCNDKKLILNNGCTVVARSSGPNASRGVGGVTWLVLDEAAFIENGKDVYASAIPTVSTGGHVIMISTPNGKDQLYYETCRRAMLKGTPDWNHFDLVKLKWYQDPRYNKFLEWTKRNKETGEVEIIKEPLIDKSGSVKYDEGHWEQMVSDGWMPRSPWYINMCMQFNNDEQKIAQELDVSFLGSASNVVPPESIEMQNSLNVRTPLPKGDDGDMFHLEDTWIWKKPVNGHRYIMACLPPGEKVLTSEGLKNIEDVNLDEKLIDKNGEETNIVNLQSHYVEEEKIYKFKISNFIRTTTFTGNHPIWGSNENKLEKCYKRYDKEHKFNERYWKHNFKFVRADELSVNDWIEIPNIYYGKELSKNEIISKWNKYSKNIRYDYAIQCPLLDEDFWWYVGMWLAKGWTMGTTLYTAHHKETKYTDRICNIFKKYNRTVTVVEKSINSKIVTVTSKPISSFLVEEFGKYAFGKRIPEWVKYLPINFKSSLIDGYLSGGGCFIKHNDDFTTRFVSVSLNLIEGIQDILMSLGILSHSRIMKEYSYHRTINGKKIKNKKEKYELTLGLYDTIKLCELLGYDTYGIKIKNRRIIKDSYFSKDFKKVYFKIKKIDVLDYTGNVYNFETESHTYCCKNIVVHNCDCSRGDSDDRSALEIIDIDGTDDNGVPCFEQVLEYNGKMTGDDLGEVAYWYGMLYNEAFCIVEAIGGYGDATILELQKLGYTNLYYDDPNLKTYTVQREASSLRLTNDGRIPGFHSSSVRFQMLSHFANMIRINEIKIRSKRTINELETWVYKNGRQDHQDGCHDDTLTCMAMGMFVYKYHLNGLQKAKEKDASFLNAVINSARRIENKYNKNDKQNINDKENAKGVKYILPVYTNKNAYYLNTVNDAYKWLIK